jgi:hypothetical protein
MEDRLAWGPEDLAGKDDMQVLFEVSARVLASS